MQTAKAEGDGDHGVCWQGGGAPSKPLYRMAQRLEVGRATMEGGHAGARCLSCALWSGSGGH